jgi:hypothetical protein
MRTGGGNIFLVIASLVLGLSLLGSIGVFAYERYLTGVRDTRAAEVAQAEELINPDSVEDFIRTRDRFIEAGEILDGHVAVSQFFDLLESLTLQSVRFDTLTFMLAEDRTAEIRIAGVARTFNSLAAQSSAFASEKRIKSAIFSNITVNDNRTVAFSLEADLDPRLLILNPPEAQAMPEVPAATTTPAAPAATTTTTAPAAPQTTPAAAPATPAAQTSPAISL